MKNEIVVRPNRIHEDPTAFQLLMRSKNKHHEVKQSLMVVALIPLSVVGGGWLISLTKDAMSGIILTAIFMMAFWQALTVVDR